MGGERFAVRNSGATAVVEGVGDHGCEYMTNGLVVVLGGTGRNFAAGMTGGAAYILDTTGSFQRNCNYEHIKLERVVSVKDERKLRDLVERHHELTGSLRARDLLWYWAESLPHFWKVVTQGASLAADASDSQSHKAATPIKEASPVDEADIIISASN